MQPTRARWPLMLRILGLALLNLVLIAVVLALSAQWQFGLTFESFVLGPTRDRIIAIANDVGKALDSQPQASWAGVLAATARRYEVGAYLFGPSGNVLGGPPVMLPPKVIDRLRTDSPPGGDRPLIQDRGPAPQRERTDSGMRPQSVFAPPPTAGPAPLPTGDFGFVPAAGVASQPVFLTVTWKPFWLWVGIRVSVKGPQGERGAPATLLLRTNSIFNRSLFEWRALLSLGFILAAVTLICWWPLVHRVTTAIREMDRATQEIAAGRFDRQLNLQREDELGDLARQINLMSAQLQWFVKDQKRFLGDIAHELSAPISRIQFALGILEQKLGDGHEERLSVLSEEIQEMSGLVNELLMFSKASVEAVKATLRPVELLPVVQYAISHQLLGAGTIDVSIPAALTVIANERYLARAVSNLLRNALRYAGADGPILVAASRHDDQVLLVVSDCGPGVPEDALEGVFAPFYRLEAARSRETGGAGLGLAIVKSCIEACRGTVSCRNRQPSGLEVTIALHAGVQAGKAEV